MKTFLVLLIGLVVSTGSVQARGHHGMIRVKLAQHHQRSSNGGQPQKKAKYALINGELYKKVTKGH